MAEQVDISILDATPEPAPAEPTSAPEAPESSPSLEQLAAQAEAELSASTGEPTEVPEKTPEPEPEPTPAPTSKLKNLIDTKYGGDEDKFVNGLYEQWNSASRMAKELEDIKKALPPTPAPADEEHPDLKWLSGQVTALDTEKTSNTREMNSLIAEGNKLQAEIYQLQGELKRADELEKTTLEAKIERAETKLDRFGSKYDALEDRNRKIEVEKRDFSRQKNIADREMAAYRAEKANQEREFSASRDKELNEFETAVDGVYKEYKIEDPKVKTYLRETIRAQAVVQIQSMPPGQRLDLAAYVKAQAAIHAEVLNLAKKDQFNKLTKDKLDARKAPLVPNGAPRPLVAPTPAPTTSTKPWSLEFAKARAAKILG